MNNSNKLYNARVAVTLCLLTLGASFCSIGVIAKADDAQSELQVVGTAPGWLRLNQAQYRNSIADIFGEDIRIPGRFESEVRREGLLAIGSRSVSITPAGMEQYDLMAREIAHQVVDVHHRHTLLPCLPKQENKANAVCTQKNLEAIGRLLFRRPMTQEEVAIRVAIAANTSHALDDYYVGLEQGLASLLIAPQFLFREEAFETEPDDPSGQRLTVYAKATRLSFLLWNSTPDLRLLDAAETGELDTQVGLARQVERLLSSPRVETGLRAFFYDMFGFDVFEDIAKDPIIYPTFSASLGDDMREQTLRMVINHVLKEEKDYRDLFTTRQTFVNRATGALHGVPAFNGDVWQKYEFPENGPSAGLLMQPSFLSLHSHPGRPSATLRGKAVRELLLCQEVPAPPGSVDFNIVQDTSNPDFKTARERLTAHRSEPMCAGCHKVTDPIGLALENFDAMGNFRLRENGAMIDPSGDLDGAAFDDARGLSQRLRDDPQIASCLVTRLYGYAIGEKPHKGDKKWLANMTKQFVEDGYRVPALLKKIALSRGFYQLESVSNNTVAASSARSE